MKPIDEIDQSPISFSLTALTEKQVEDFRRATHTEFTKCIPPTFPTTFRKAEFEFLDRCEVDMRLLLHVEQEYEYHGSFKVGDPLVVRTWVAEIRERRGMFFFTLATELTSNGVVKVVSRTVFVVRKEGTEAK